MLKDEPVGVFAALAAFLNALLAVVAWWREMSPEAITLCAALIAAFIVLAGAVVRARVIPMAKLRRIDPAIVNRIET
jgi:ABC-type antimicrobial peptide transport system permease subunit